MRPTVESYNFGGSGTPSEGPGIAPFGIWSAVGHRGNTVQMADSLPFRLVEDNRDVEVTPSDDETVTIRLGGKSDGITLVGSRFDVHSMIIEVDRQLGRLSPRFSHQY